jgi:hypothetical protein
MSNETDVQSLTPIDRACFVMIHAWWRGNTLASIARAIPFSPGKDPLFINWAWAHTSMRDKNVVTGVPVTPS